jgi:hypothetical protein
MTFPLIVCIDDAGRDRNYTSYVIAPPGMDSAKARGLVDVAIREIKAEHPDDYEWDQLIARLTPLGFTEPSWVRAIEDW